MTKDIIEDYKTLSIFFLKKKGYLKELLSFNAGTITWSIGGNEILKLGFSINLQSKIKYISVYNNYIENKIILKQSKCNYGGYRYWFICPISGIRCGILYMQEDGQFACRKALNLAYIDQNRSKKWRVFNNFFPYEDIAENLYKTIKYKHRNGKLTRKYKKYLRLMRI